MAVLFQKSEIFLKILQPFGTLRGISDRTNDFAAKVVYRDVMYVFERFVNTLNDVYEADIDKTPLTQTAPANEVEEKSETISNAENEAPSDDWAEEKTTDVPENGSKEIEDQQRKTTLDAHMNLNSGNLKK